MPQGTCPITASMDAPESKLAALATKTMLLTQLLKLASLISRPMIEGVALPNGISANMLRVIMCLAGEGPCAGQEISVMMGLAPMGVSRALTDLNAKGWVEYVDSRPDRRRKPVQLSAAGWQAYRELIPHVATVAESLLGSLDARDCKALERLSRNIILNIEDWESGRTKGMAGWLLKA